jgi:hypothetical protein
MDLSGGNESEEQSRESKVFHKVAVCASLKWIRPVAKFICLRTRVSTVEGTSFWAVVPVGEGGRTMRPAVRCPAKTGNGKIGRLEFAGAGHPLDRKGWRMPPPGGGGNQHAAFADLRCRPGRKPSFISIQDFKPQWPINKNKPVIISRNSAIHLLGNLGNHLFYLTIAFLIILK